MEVFSGVFHRAFFCRRVRRASRERAGEQRCVVHVIDCVLVPSPQPLPTRAHRGREVLAERTAQRLRAGPDRRRVITRGREREPDEPADGLRADQRRVYQVPSRPTRGSSSTPRRSARRTREAGVTGDAAVPLRPREAYRRADEYAHVANRLRTFEGGEVFVERYEGRGARSGAWGASAEAWERRRAGVFGSSGKERLFVNGCATRAVDFVCATASCTRSSASFGRTSGTTSGESGSETRAGRDETRDA